MSKVGVFISYSREDESLVTPLSKMLQVGRDDLVFQDVLVLKPGQQWNNEILAAIDQCDFFFILWCQHSSKSEYVSKEMDAAINSGKNIVPILLDNTPLSQSLAPYQWIDYRSSGGHKRRFVRLLGWLIGFLIFLALLVLLVRYLTEFWIPRGGADDEISLDKFRGKYWYLGIISMLFLLWIYFKKRRQTVRVPEMKLETLSKEMLTIINRKHNISSRPGKRSK